MSINNVYLINLIYFLYVFNCKQFRCVAKNNLINKTKFSKVGYLSIVNTGFSGSNLDIQPLAFISPTSLYPSVKYVTEGKHVTFECAATGVPSPLLNWSFTTSTGKSKNKHHLN